jgi:hypothetical protein
MRIVTILLLTLVITACASRPTLEELEEQAMASGDWTAVEYHEEMARKRNGGDALNCPKGQTKFCVESGLRVDCKCVLPSSGGR